MEEDTLLLDQDFLMKFVVDLAIPFVKKEIYDKINYTKRNI